jgi:hypothetical protein
MHLGLHRPFKMHTTYTFRFALLIQNAQRTKPGVSPMRPRISDTVFQGERVEKLLQEKFIAEERIHFTSSLSSHPKYISSLHLC